jgi:hypothetical protein
MQQGFWILQTHREEYDPDLHPTAVGAETLWAVWNRTDEFIARGDKVALYVMGKRKGIFAFGEVVSGVHSLSQSDKVGSPAAVTKRPRFEAEHAVRIRYDRILREPISFGDIVQIFGRELALVTNVQRLNYQVTKSQWDDLNAMSPVI